MKSHYIYNKVKGLLLLTLLVTAAMTASAQTKVNELVINDFVGSVGKPISVPIYLNNADEVVTAQFDIKLPFAAPADNVCTLSNRSDQHSVSFSQTGTNTYRVLIINMENRPLRGNAGLLLRMPMQAKDDGQTATAYPVTISNVVLTDNQGNNIATSQTATGNFRVNYEELPDLTVSAVVPQTQQAAPGGEVTITYDVQNIGSGSTRAGWTEKLYLESTNGTRTYIGSQTYESVLAGGATANRTFKGTLPALLYMDGEAKVVVEVIPSQNTGELLAEQGNNTGESEVSMTLSKRLLLTTNTTTVREGVNYGYATVTFSRSGDCSLAETYTVSCSVSGLMTCNGLSMPCTVTIPAGMAGVTLRIAAVNDNIVRAREADISVGAANGYEGVTLHLNRTDDDQNPLSLSLSSATLTEGDVLTLTGERGGELTDELKLNVSCTKAARFDQTFVLHFDKGQKVATTTATAIHDNVPQLDTDVKFTVSAKDYRTASATLRLNDDDRPAITMTLSQPSVVENMGSNTEALPLVATIKRDRGTEQDIVVWLTSSRNEVAFEKNKVTIPAGTDQVEVALTVTDNSKVDGQRTATLTAALYVTADQKAAPAGDRANSQCPLTIVDDEEPYLTLTSQVCAVGEGSSATVTVRRYVPNTSQPLTVTLSCDDPRGSFTSPTVTIPAGSSTATATLNVIRNTQEGDDAEALLTAKATGLNDGLLKLLITDRTLPDAVNPSIVVTGAPFYSGLEANIRATIRNVGTSELPKGMTMNFYLASTDRLYYYTRSYDFFQAMTDQAIPVGGEATFDFTAPLPQLVGNWWIYARLNPDGHIKEFNTGNNLTQVFCPITIKAPFEVESISATPEDCLPGSLVTVQGRMKAVPGSYLNGQTVEVELAGAGQRTNARTQIDAGGNFNVCMKVDRSAHGYLTVKALAVGQTEPAKTTQIQVYNMSLTADNSRWTFDENTTTTGSLTLRNLSAKPINVTEFLTSEPLPDNAEITFDTKSIGTIAAGSSVAIPYTVKALKPSSARQQFIVTAKSAEGLESQLTISYFCQATNANLVFTPRELRTTMLFNADREGVVVKVKNTGKKTSGPISELIQSDWMMTDFGNNRTLQPGEEATIHLTFLAQDYMHTGRSYTNYLQLSPENGSAAVLPITVTATGDELSDFDLQVTDVYALAKNDNSHVAGAEVTVTNVRSGKTFLTGTVGSDGHWKTTQMREGLYEVKVKANRHKTVTQQMTVGPGEDRTMTMLLPYKAVVTDFVVDQDLVENTYTMKQYIDIDRMAPQGTIVAEIRDEGFGCGSETVEVILRNEGQRAATNIELTLPVVNGYTFTALNAMPSIMQPGDVHILQLACTGPETGMKRVIAKMRLHYEFDIKGERLSEDDVYQTLVGCTIQAETPEPPAVNPDDIDDDDEPTGPGAALPSYNGWVRLELEDLTDIRCGQPLHAVLRVKNGQQTALRSLRFIPQISDMDFEDCTMLFSYKEGDADGFQPDGSNWQLAGQFEGTLDIDFIPLAAAAADGPHTYYLSGQVAYIDSHSGIRNTASLPLFTITVQPSGDVQLTYLLQHNFLGDDAETEELEQTEPAMFALLARNLGPVAVTDLQLQSSMPAVVGNHSAKSVAYTTEYAAVNGQAGNLTFTDLQLDEISADATAAVQWIYTSQKSAHVNGLAKFAETVQAAVGSGAGVVVSQPRELVRAVASRSVTPADAAADAGEQELKIMALSEGDTYLLNDIDDEQRQPDVVLTANGEEVPLHVVSQQSTIVSGDAVGDYKLTVHADENGWVYGRLHDPTNNLMRLESVTRLSDGKKVSLANFWQTTRTPLTDYTMLQENILHFADELSGQAETYLLHYVARPDDDVQVMDVKLYTANGHEVSDGGTTTAKVTRIEVVFNDAIRTLYKNRVLLTAHSDVQNLEDATIAGKDNNRQWTIDISALTGVPGEHTFTVNGSLLKTRTGKKVSGEMTVSWNENLSGSALITVYVAPDELHGSTTPSTGELSFGNHTITANPAEGYEFVKWTDNERNGELLSTEAALKLDVYKPRTLTAHFAPQTFDIIITCGEQGELKGSASGNYDYGEDVLLAVQPKPGYLFDGWWRDGQRISDLQSTIDAVKGNYKYEARFRVNPDAVAFVLDENFTTSPSASDGRVNLTVRRTIKGGEWSTLCLPFAMSEQQVKDVFGETVQLGNFQGYEVRDGGSTIVVKFEQETSIAANHPYIIKTDINITSFSVGSVEVIPVDKPAINYGTDQQPSAMVGTYVNGTTVGYGCLFLNGGKFWYSTGRTITKGYRAWFQFADVLPLLENGHTDARIVIDFDGSSETTTIGRVTASGMSSPAYDLGGRRRGQLSKGVYIENGKKIIIK